MKDFLIVKLDVFWLGLVASQGELSRVCLSCSEDSILEDIGIKPSEKPSVSSLLQALSRDLANHWKGKRVDFSRYSLKLASYPSFSRKVWSQTRLIPYGETRSYKWVAQAISSKAFRAVGKALGNNPFPIIIPCHRVIKGDGELGGYSWGLGIKRRLLEIEGFPND